MKEAGYIVNCVLNAFLSYTAIALNSVTIHALRKAASLPKPLKTLLLSLAVSDLGVGLIVQPLFIAVTAKKSSTYDITFIVYRSTTNLLLYASFFGVMALSADRFLAIHLHLRYQELVTYKRVVAVVISIWLFSALLSLLRFCLPENFTSVIFAFTIASCLFATTLFYYKIYLAVRRHANQIRRSQQEQQAAQNGEMENAATLRKFAVGAFFVYLAFLVCYLPRTCTLVTSIFTSSTNFNGGTLYTTTLVFLNSSLNPLIYSWKMRHIRNAVIGILWNMLRSHNQRTAGEDAIQSP